jgi:PAS domain S-box-containing protein
MNDLKYPLTDIETKRLEALRSYHVLDTLPEKEYDAITRLASYICQVPVALISLMDGDRQWFKSKVGMDVIEIPRGDSFCNQTILHDEIRVVPNMLEDNDFKHSTMVTGEAHIRFYAGAPLIDPDGYRIGSLCVLDVVPRELTTEQHDALGTLADEVMSNLLLKKKTRALQASLETHKEFFNLFNSSPEIHFIADADAKIEIINDAVTPILGYTPEQAIGHSLWDFVAGKNREQFVPLIEKALATGTAFEIETETVSLTNEVKWIGWCAINKMGKWYASGRDITYQKNLLSETKQLSLVASKVINGVVISNAKDEILWVNDAFEHITGYCLADVEHKRMPDVIKRTEKSLDIQKYRELIDKKQSYEVELHIIRKDGKSLWISVINTVILDDAGEVEKHIRVIIDINARKGIESDLQILSFASRKLPSGMLIRDNDGVIIWMNEALEKTLGYTLAEMKGKTFGDLLIGKKTDKATLDAAAKITKEKKAYDIEIQLYRKDGSPIWISWSNSPLLNDRGKVERQISVMADITKRKNAEAEVKMLSLVASNTTSGVIINDSNGNVEWVNNAFEKITGYTIEDTRDKHLGDVLKGELTDTSIIEHARELSRNKQSFEVDLLAYRRDGKQIWLSVINSVIVNSEDKVDKYIEVIIDITSKKKIEQELIAAKEEALQLSRAKDMFISVMSHEIRTPLNAVIGMSHLLLEEDPMDYQKQNLSVLKFSAQNLMGLINDVLDFTKIETGNIQLEKTDVDLRALVTGITSSMQYKTTEKNIYLNCDIEDAIPEVVIGDTTRLSQILLNLVSNAVKFTDTGGVTIKLQAIEQKEDSVRIRFEVKDTGIGIANDKLNTIFDSFKQADLDTTRKYGGTGLGLAISKRLIELHDSRINVDSELGKGSNFWFTITFNKSDRHKNYDYNVDSTLNISVLVVDDNQINRLLINKILTKWGAKADFAENGLEAVTKIESSQKYNVVLMDIHMPMMGGLEATQVIRSKNEPYFKQLPIIALTASMLNSQIDQIGIAGMNDYLLKPFEPKVLYEKLSRYQSQ